jgi:catechol 2,3-dioxygenase-like lactoylglutathione lyase family enzyme
MKLRQAVLFVKQFVPMLRFYQGALGLPVLPGQSEGWAVLDAGGVTLGLHAIPDEYAKEIAISSPPAAREETPLKLVFEVPDLDAARAHLASHGATVMEKKPWGACDVLDPEGNVFQIAQERVAAGVTSPASA